jgi:hypothetical protein
MHSEYENESLNSSQPLRMDTDIARLVLKEATERRTRTKGITSGVSGHVDYRSRAAGGGFGRRELEESGWISRYRLAAVQGADGNSRRRGHIHGPWRILAARD